MKEQLESDFSKELKKQKVLYTRLRTPNYGFKGVRYPADFIVWAAKTTALVECKERRSLPLAPSAIRQIPFMEEWNKSLYSPLAEYYILVRATEKDMCYLFSSEQAVHARENRKSLREGDELYSSSSLRDVIEYIKGEIDE